VRASCDDLVGVWTSEGSGCCLSERLSEQVAASGTPARRKRAQKITKPQRALGCAFTLRRLGAGADSIKLGEEQSEHSVSADGELCSIAVNARFP